MDPPRHRGEDASDYSHLALEVSNLRDLHKASRHPDSAAICEAGFQFTDDSRGGRPGSKPSVVNGSGRRGGRLRVTWRTLRPNEAKGPVVVVMESVLHRRCRDGERTLAHFCAVSTDAPLSKDQ